jgi:hypothetical protein
MSKQFKIPNKLQSARESFMQATWQNCTSLTSGSPAEPLNFPNIASDGY